MEDPQSCKALSDGSLADTPLQILKYSDFVTAMDERFEPNLKPSAKSRLECVIPHWLQTLEKTDKRGFSAFPRPGTQQYRLEDHLWIWKALKSIENLDLGAYLRAEGCYEGQRIRMKFMNFAEDGSTKAPESMTPLLGDYRPEQIQRKVLKRFTTENAASGRRMIAVSRTPTETRFMFHSTDSILLCNSNAQFFEKAGPLWKATMESQRFYQENEQSFWENPLQYATALIMSSNGYQTSAKSAPRMFKEYRRILLRICPPNGIFAGQIDPVTKEPQIFQERDERDSYWNVSFEIPGILWESGVQIAQGVWNNGTQVEMSVQSDSAVLPTERSCINLQIEDGYQPNDSSKIETFFPSSTLNGQKDIVELADEWLYSYPEFLDFDPCIRHRFEDFQSLGQCGIETGDLLSRAIRKFKECRRLGTQPMFASDCLKGIIVDVAKTMRKNERRTRRKIPTPAQDSFSPNDIQVCNKYEFFQKMDGLRTAQKAKKRLVWLPNIDEDTALICFLASPESEKITVSSFFERHDRREDFLSESVVAASNIWTTEFHLSWYQIHDKCQSDGCQKISFLSTKREVGKAAVGFLLTGDFFDRYWTCRVLEYEPDFKEEQQANEKSELTNELKSRCETFLERAERFSPPGVKHPWRQRRVLELLLVDFMLDKVSMQHNTMLEEVTDHLGKLLSASKPDFPQTGGTPDIWNAFFSSQINTRTYTSFSKHWPPIQCILQILENDLTAILERISIWNVRERDREPEKPRWTINDERKYRSAITTLVLSNNQKIRKIEQHLADIQSLSTYLKSRIEFTRNELSLQSAENVRFFTLVTSVFLPLGFATAIFSMNGMPGQSELTGWAILAAVSVFLTFFVLYFGDLNQHILEARDRLETRIKRRDTQQNGRDDGNDHESKSKRSPDTAQQRGLRSLVSSTRRNHQDLEKGKGK